MSFLFGLLLGALLCLAALLLCAVFEPWPITHDRCVSYGDEPEVEEDDTDLF